jgi:polysaccharide export outer membrane protein
MYLRLKCIVISGLMLTVCVSCAPLSDVHAPSDTVIPMKSYNQAYAAAPLDRIDVTKKNGEIVNLSLSADRKLEYPQGNTINMAGLNPDQITAKLKKVDPSIRQVTYSEFRANRVALTGEVNIQTHLDLQDAPIRALDAIAAAGGFTPLANTRRVRLLRENAGRVEVYELNMNDVMHGRNMQQNMLLQAGDSIYVPRTLL